VTVAEKHLKTSVAINKGAVMADVTPGERPLSPHLSIYRPQLMAISSIVNRLTGISLVLAAFLIVWWLLAAATSPEAYALANGIITSVPGDLVMTLSVWAVWYHYLAGLRHLYFDAGNGLEIETAEKLGWAVVIGSVVLTLLTMIIIQ
jgi:succinate dehydrogenase cytochrome b subunit